MGEFFYKMRVSSRDDKNLLTVKTKENSESSSSPPASHSMFLSVSSCLPVVLFSQSSSLSLPLHYLSYKLYGSYFELFSEFSFFPFVHRRSCNRLSLRRHFASQFFGTFLVLLTPFYYCTVTQLPVK